MCAYEPQQAHGAGTDNTETTIGEWGAQPDSSSTVVGVWAIARSIKLTGCCEFLTERNTLATNKASGLTASTHLNNAKALFAQEGATGLSAWFSLWQDYNARGIKAVSKWAEQYKLSSHCNVSNSVSTISQYVGAIDRAVKKYGSLGNAKKEHMKFVNADDGYMFADITNFVKFAPEGQRAKGVAKDKPVVIEREAMKYSVAQLEKMLAFRKKAMAAK